MFTSDNRTEQFLTTMGVKFEYENGVTFDRLRPDWRDHNPSRPVPFREEAVLEYGALMDAGSAAPAVILGKLRSQSKLDVLDGRQRLGAAELGGYSNVSAYVVTTNSKSDLMAISVLANARLQGRAEPIEYTRRNSVEKLVVDGTWSAEEVAKKGGWTVKDIRDIADCIRWQRVIANCGGPKFPDTMIRVIADVATPAEFQRYHKPVVTFCNSIKKARLSAEDASPYVDQFFAGKLTHDKLKERLEDFKSDPEIQARLNGRKTGSMPPDVRLKKQMKGVVTVLDEIMTSGFELPYVDEFFKIMKDIDKSLKSLHRKGPKKNTPRVPADKWSDK